MRCGGEDLAACPQVDLPTTAAKAAWLVDPDGLVGDAEYDLDATAIWDWSVIERVSTGLVATEIDLQPVGRELLALADRLSMTSGVRPAP